MQFGAGCFKLTGYVLLVFFLPPPDSHVSRVVIQVQRSAGRKENVSLYICYVTQSDCTLPPSAVPRLLALSEEVQKVRQRDQVSCLRAL